MCDFCGFGEREKRERETAFRVDGGQEWKRKEEDKKEKEAM